MKSIIIIGPHQNKATEMLRGSICPGKIQVHFSQVNEWVWAILGLVY